MTRAEANVHGVLVVDKPTGPTSHDIVARLRRALGTRRVGHAGTLDPGASGVLVALVGEATKLSPYLTAHRKSYAATVTFGTATNTWDADGEVIATGPLPANLALELARLAESSAGQAALWPALSELAPNVHQALAVERARRWQVPPAFSAIKQAGQASHRLARRGQDVEHSPRPVDVHELDVVGATPQTLDVVLHVAKGYYVRAFAHDLGASLGAPAHLSALRRLASGCFSIEEACSLSALSVRGALLPVRSAVRRAMPCGVLTGAGLAKAGHGQRLDDGDFSERPPASPAAWLDSTGELAAVGAALDGGGYRALRGFAQPTSSDET